MKELRIHGGLLARNTAISLLGSVIPLGVAFAATPFLVRHLGVERFGILSLAWTVLWYSSYFDLGLTRATTKFVAEALGNHSAERIPALVWTSLAAQAHLGLFAAAAVAVATPLSVERILRIPAGLTGEARTAFYLVGATIPFFLCANIFAALLSSAQRFDLVNAIKIPNNSLLFLLPVCGVWMGFGLRGIFFLLFLSRVITLAGFYFVCAQVLPGLKRVQFADRSTLRSLLSFGGWVTICNVLIPVLVNVDRFVIGAVLSMAAVAYYLAPFQLISGLLIIPGALGGVIYPAFSALVAEQRERLGRLYCRSLKSTLLLVGPAILILAVFARDILRLWLGTEFVVQSTRTLQVLAAGALLNALAHIPANLLDGIGRPDLRAKIFLSYVLPYLGLLPLLVRRLGIVGAALIWSLRAGLELVLFAVVAANLMKLPGRIFIRNGFLKGAVACGTLGGFLTALKLSMRQQVLAQTLAIAVVLMAFLLASWRFVLDATDRQSIAGVFRAGNV